MTIPPEAPPPAEALPATATYFLTWHGTVLRTDRQTGQLIHARLWPVRDVAEDWELALPGGGVRQAMARPADARLTLRPLQSPRLVAVECEGAYLCAEPMAGEVRFSRAHIGPWESFLLLTGHELDALRDALAHGWTGDASEAVLSASVGPAMILRVGDLRADLQRGLPSITEGGSAMRLSESGPLLRRGAALPEHAEIALARRPVEAQAPVVADHAALQRNASCRLNLIGAPEYAYPPLAASRADEDWMLERWTQPGERRLGRFSNTCQLVREANKFVLLQRGRDGIIFDARGTCNEPGHLMGLDITEDGPLTREGERVFIGQDALDRAPRLAGPHAVFYCGNLSDYYHWTVEALLPLHVMAPFLPAGTRLIMPSVLRAHDLDRVAALHAWGFGDFPAVDIDGPVCHAEEVYWLDQCAIQHMPAALLQAARADALARLRPGGPKRNIFISRAQGPNVANRVLVEGVARNHGFSVHALEDLPPPAQMELFRDAACVVAPHGAELANLLFCAPGTAVLELSPECEFRPFFAQISDKLDLVHAVLPCPTEDGGFFSGMTVDVKKFRALLRLVLARQEAA